MSCRGLKERDDELRYIYIYIYIERERERRKNKVFQSDEFIVKESQCYNVSVLINHHQDLKNNDTKDILTFIVDKLTFSIIIF